MTDFSETDALKLALDANSRKRGGAPAWLRGALQPRQPERTEPEPARLSGEALIRALHGEPPDDDDDDDLPPAA